MTMPISAERHGRAPIRIVRDASARRASAFQPEWEPLSRADVTPEHRPQQGRNGAGRMPGRYFDAALSIALSVCVSAFVTLALTVRAVGLAPELTDTWLTTLKLSLLIGLPARFLFEPYVARLVGLFVRPPLQ